MIKINDKFSVERDKYQWLLIESKDGLSKKQEPIVTTRTTYHGTLKQCCNEIAERMMGECESVQGIETLLESIETIIDDVLAKIEVK